MSNAFGRQVVVPLVNKSGGSVIAGDVVVVDTSNNEAFTTSTAGAVTGGVGIAQETIPSNGTGRVLMHGYAALVNVNASVTRGNYGKTHTVVKQATDAGSSRVAGAFCQFLTGGTTPSARVYSPDLGAAAGNVAADAIWDAAGDLAQGTGADTAAKLSAVATGKVLVSQGVGVANAWGYPPFHGVRATATAATSIANATLTAVPFAAADRYDTDAYHDTVTNNTRITIPAGLGGYYRLGGTIALAGGSTTGFRLLGVRLNGSTYIALIEAEPGGGLSSEQFIAISTEYDLVATDYAELIYYQSSGGSVVLSSNGTYGAQFWASLAGV